MAAPQDLVDVAPEQDSDSDHMDLPVDHDLEVQKPELVEKKKPAQEGEPSEKNRFAEQDTSSEENDQDLVLLETHPFADVIIDTERPSTKSRQAVFETPTRLSTASGESVLFQPFDSQRSSFATSEDGDALVDDAPVEDLPDSEEPQTKKSKNEYWDGVVQWTPAAASAEPSTSIDLALSADTVASANSPATNEPAASIDC